MYTPMRTERYIDILSRFDGYEFRFFGNARAYIYNNIMCADEKKIYKTGKKLIKSIKKSLPNVDLPKSISYTMCVFYTLEVIINNAVSTTVAAINNKKRRTPRPVPTQ